MILTDIENMATSAFISLIAKSDYLVPSINSLDRGPSWDGKILVYDKPGDNHSKDDYKYGIPVQIKGKKLKRTKKKFSYPVEISDLKNYKKEVGVVFVVVCFDDNGENIHIYYKALLSYDLKRLLKDSDNQKTKMIHLRELPSNVNKVTEIFLTIADDFERQKADSSIEEILSYEDLTRNMESPEIFFNCTVLESNENSVFDYLLENGAYIYTKTKEGIPIPVDYVEAFSGYVTKYQGNVSVNGKIFYSEYFVARKKDETILTFGKSSRFYFNNQKNEFKLNGTLSERILDCEFYLSLSNGASIYVDSYEICCSTLDSFPKDGINEIKMVYNELKEIKKMLIALDVKEELKMDNLTNVDIYNIKRLLEAFHGNEIELKDIGKPFGCYNIANLKILICAQKNPATGLFKVHNFFKAPYRVVCEYGNRKKVIPLFTILNAKEIVMYCNINAKRVLEEIETTDYTDVVSDYIIHFLLEVIKAFDICHNDNLLEFTNNIISVIGKKPFIGADTLDMLRLNELQIIKRQRKLNLEEISELKCMLKSNDILDEFRLGILLLLDAYLDSELIFESFDEEHQKVFSNYPIFNFYKESHSN